MPTAPRGGTETFWRVWGDGKPQVLMLHCTLAHSGAWTGLAETLGRAALAFDMPGHGKSGAPDPGRDYQAQCLDAALDFLTGGAMDLIGHSFGATVALRLAAERPDLVRRLVLIEPVFFAAAKGTAAYDAHKADLRPFIDALEAGEPERAARIFTGMWGAGVAWEDMRAAQRQVLTAQIHIIPAQDAALFHDNAGLLAPGRLESLRAPVLLLEGGASPAIIGAISEALARRLPNARRQVIEGAGHMLPITHPDAVAAVAAPFLSR